MTHVTNNRYMICSGPWALLHRELDKILAESAITSTRAYLEHAGKAPPSLLRILSTYEKWQPLSRPLPKI